MSNIEKYKHLLREGKEIIDQSYGIPNARTPHGTHKGQLPMFVLGGAQKADRKKIMNMPWYITFGDKRDVDNAGYGDEKGAVVVYYDDDVGNALRDIQKLGFR